MITLWHQYWPDNSISHSRFPLQKPLVVCTQWNHATLWREGPLANQSQIKNLKLDFWWNVKLEWSSFHFSSPTIRLGHRGQIQWQPCLAEERVRMDGYWLTLQITVRSLWSSWFHTDLSSLVHKLSSLFQIRSMLYIAVRGFFFQEGESCTVCDNRDTV